MIRARKVEGGYVTDTEPSDVIAEVEREGAWTGEIQVPCPGAQDDQSVFGHHVCECAGSGWVTETPTIAYVGQAEANGLDLPIWFLGVSDG